MSDEIAPFHLDVPQEELIELSARLASARWPESETVDGWDQGIPLDYLRELCHYWADGYDWRPCESALNDFGQFRTEIDGLGVHFLHVPSPHPDAVPVVMTHGWPGSVIEFLKVIDPLTDPTAYGGDAGDAFHVVCPSLPGYGFSDKPTTTGYGVERIAAMWAELMARLGYDRYGAQGGDWGAAVSSVIGATDTEHCIGVHLNMVIAGPDKDTFGELTPAEQQALDDMAHHGEWGTGYSQEQSTRPQTIGYSLVDSPVGLAAWILEKFWAWTDCDGHPENVLTRDELIDNLMLYWLPATGASAARLYWESFRSLRDGTVDVPTGCSIFPKEIIRPSRRWAERRYPNIVYWNELERGGHFAAFEQPDLLVDEVRAFFRLLR